MIALTLTLSLMLSVVFASPFENIFSQCFFPEEDIPNLIIERGYEEEWNITIAPEGHLMEFGCKPGFMTKGLRVVSCIEGRWTGRFPTCIEKYCSFPPVIPNTKHRVHMGVNTKAGIGSTVVYQCTSGYRLAQANVSSLKCILSENDLIWDGTFPECVELDSCPDPGRSSDGRRRGKCCQIGSKVAFACNRNFELVGDPSIRCLEGAIWSAPRPRCRPISEDHCPEPPEIPNGSIENRNMGDYYLFDEFAMVKCLSGFSPRGGETVVFCDGSQWEGEFAKCEEVSCKRPANIENGTISELEETNSTVFPFGFQLNHKCSPGFRLVGDSTRSCGDNGWSGKAPYCEVIRCYDPGNPEHGEKEGFDFGIGSKVQFSCFPGYTLIGSSERYCATNGQWSGELARCDAPGNYCPNPGTPVNGWKSGNNYDNGVTVLFGCHPGFFLLGSSNRTCESDRTWTGDEPTCRGPHDFDSKADVAEKLIKASESKVREQKEKYEHFKQSRMMVYTKTFGLNGTFEEMDAVLQRGRILDLNYPGRIILYFVFDASGSIGHEDFRTSIEFAKALVRKVGISKNGARAGAVTFSSTAQSAFLPVNYENTEEVLAALDRIEQESGGTSINDALNEVLEEMIPLTRPHLGTKGVKSVVFLLTDGKANIAGDPEIQARALKEAGVEIYCIGITGNIKQQTLHKIASTPIEEHVFILKDYQILHWLIQEITNGTVDYSQCGLGLRKGIVHKKPGERGRIIGGKEVTDPWPWMAALFIDGKLQCGGSLIGQTWVLTAAHCLVHENKIRDLKTIIVKLGLTAVTNFTDLQEFESEQFIIHKDYHAISLDYDIALIKLDKPVVYTDKVRPICLPPKDLPKETTLYKAKVKAFTAGWGYNKEKEANEQVHFNALSHLKELELPVQSRDTCRESIKRAKAKYNFTERMFCAGSGLGGNDTCDGDSGGPLMQSQMNKDGLVYWTQVGIVSWGHGCGLMHTYGFYTHIHNIRQWITEKLGI